VKITGSYTIDAPRDRVWAALNDIEVLARVVPGCERLEQIGENEYEGTVKIGIQTIRGTYNGRIRLEDIQPPHHYRLVASGRSSNAVVDGVGTVDLEEQDGKTVLNYAGDAQIGGVLASVGQRLIESAAKQLINQSLKALAEQIKIRESGPPAEQAVSAAAAAPAAMPTAESPAPTPPGAPPPPAGQPPQPAFERRTVVVPEHEQLKPASVVRGVAEDVLKERPWLAWVVIAFILGFLLGRAQR
jgi:carbon monoxide dehydrogenase subunit G